MQSTPNSQSDRINFITASVAQTREFGTALGRRLQPGTVLGLYGDLGSGKTALVQGLAKGLDVPDHCYITSPTYTLINEYPGRCRLYHIDLYRLDDPVAIEDLGFEEIVEADGVVAVEWAERLDPLPGDPVVRIEFEILDDSKRALYLSGPQAALEALMKSL